jgi:hypothetical protein
VSRRASRSTLRARRLRAHPASWTDTHPHWSNTNGSPAAIMVGCRASGVPGLMEFPKRSHPGMDALHAMEHLPADAHMRDGAVGDDGPGDRDRPLRVIGRLADPPLAFRIPCIARNDRTRSSLETADAIGVATRHLAVRQRLGLLADRIADGDPSKARGNAFNARIVEGSAGISRAEPLTSWTATRRPCGRACRRPRAAHI